MKYSSIVFALASVCLTAGTVGASYIHLNVADRRDYAFDRNGLLYISTGTGSVLRYDTAQNTFLNPLVVGGSLMGIDLAPDGQTLAVADLSTQGSQNRIHLVNTSTGAATQVSFSRQSLEAGTFMVAWGSDNRLLVTSTFSGSGWIPLRRHDPQTGVTTTLGSVRQNTMLTPSADRKTIGIAEDNISSGPISDFDVVNGSIDGTIATNWFTFEVAVDRDGDKFVVPTYGGTFVYDKTGSSFDLQGTLGDYADFGPIAAVFSPVNDVFFTAEWTRDTALGVRVYDANSLALLATIDPYPFDWVGNNAMGSGRMEISPDGRMLAVSVDGGVRLYDVSAFVPEPSSAVLLLAGGTLAICFMRRRHPGQSARSRVPALPGDCCA